MTPALIINKLPDGTLVLSHPKWEGHVLEVRPNGDVLTYSDPGKRSRIVFA